MPAGTIQPAPLLILARREGQLANRIMLGAYLISFAGEHRFRLWIPALAEYADFFQGSIGDPLCRFPAQTPEHRRRRVKMPLRRAFSLGAEAVAWILARVPFSIPGLGGVDIKISHDAHDMEYRLDDPQFLRLLASRRTIFLRGWKFRHEGLLESRRQEVLSYFAPIPSIQHRVDAALEAARQGSNDLLLGVHIRQGDYREWQGGKFFYETAHYRAWMQQAAALFPGKKVRFLLCSNAQIDPSFFSDLKVAAGPGDPVGDLYALAGCDYLMGPPSTFTLWASYYGNVPLHMLLTPDQILHPVSFTHHGKC